MPLSEFYRLMNRSSQQKRTCSNDLSFMPGNEVVELVWENGQITTQGQSSRARKGSCPNNLPSQTSRLQEKDAGNAAGSSRTGKLGIDLILNDDVPSGQEDDIVPWLNYSVDDDYCSEFWPEISGVTTNEPSSQSSFASTNKVAATLANYASLEFGSTSKASLSRRGSVNPWASSQPSQMAMPSHSGFRNADESNIGNLSSENPNRGDGLTHFKVQKSDLGRPNSSSSLLNFSHFSRPAASARANLQNLSFFVASSSASGGAKVEKEDTVVPPAADGNSAKLTLGNPGDGFQRETVQSQPNMTQFKVDSIPCVARSLDESGPAELSHAVGKENVARNNKTSEPVVACSSVCSGNSADTASNDLPDNLKRKCPDDGECDCPSEDIEEDSEGVNKGTPVQGSGGSKAGSKRSRAAEVHNRSERRRRERINEKMRALQELIPNCNKVDKASMLDEAIEYLKTLQLQVQIMSMGAGLYMPPTMLPAGLQHLCMAQMPHYLPMGVGMGMGMGYGMGVPEMNGVPPGCPTIPLSSMHGAHFLPAPFSGATNFLGVPGSCLQGFRHRPGQGLPMSIPGAPFHPLSGWSTMNSAMATNASGAGTNSSDVPNPAGTLNSNEPVAHDNSQEKGNDVANQSMNHSNQRKATNQGFHTSSNPAKNEQPPHVSGIGRANSTKANEAATSKSDQ